MRRRVSIGVSTLGNPKIIFFDEPTTGLDPITQREIMKLILVKKFKKIKILESQKRKSGDPDNPPYGRS